MRAQAQSCVRRFHAGSKEASLAETNDGSMPDGRKVRASFA
jgi:3-methyladenine DNA glycosylase AlkC